MLCISWGLAAAGVKAHTHSPPLLPPPCLQFDKLEELIYMESHLSNTSAKFYGEITQQMLKNASFPGSNNGTGLFQTIVGLKVSARFHTATGLHAGTQHGACTTPGASTSCRDICRLAQLLSAPTR